jgi:hypothetical protein
VSIPARGRPGVRVEFLTVTLIFWRVCVEEYDIHGCSVVVDETLKGWQWFIRGLGRHVFWSRAHCTAEAAYNEASSLLDYASEAAAAERE